MTPHQSEAEFQATFIEWLELHRWTVHAERPARSDKGWRTPIQGRPGFFDVVAVKDGTLLLAELKSETGRVTEDQQHWITSACHVARSRSCIMVMLLRPSDWPKIAALLS